MQIGGPAARASRTGRGFACVYQYDEDEEPCMVIFKARQRGMPNRPVHLIHLRDLWKYNDDGYLWRASREMVENLTGEYSRFEHNNLFFFVNDCLQYLLEMKPFPEDQMRKLPAFEIKQVADNGYLFVGNA